MSIAGQDVFTVGSSRDAKVHGSTALVPWLGWWMGSGSGSGHRISILEQILCINIEKPHRNLRELLNKWFYFQDTENTGAYLYRTQVKLNWKMTRRQEQENWLNYLGRTEKHMVLLGKDFSEFEIDRVRRFIERRI